MGKQTHGNTARQRKRHERSQRQSKGTRIYVYLRMYADYPGGYNRSGWRNRCRCLFANALRGNDGGTAGSTRAFLEAARASRNLQKEARENDKGEAFGSGPTTFRPPSSVIPFPHRLLFFYSSRRETFTSLILYLPRAMHRLRMGTVFFTTSVPT